MALRNLAVLGYFCGLVHLSSLLPLKTVLADDDIVVIKEAQTAAGPEKSQSISSDEQQKFSQLCKWIQKHGGKGINSIQLGFFDHGGKQVRGIASSRYLPAFQRSL